ncbi:unnamed protein product [Closterium sp. NIES-65]|nr:unnamed protein product [Closterium sp. NIES-65]
MVFLLSQVPLVFRTAEVLGGGRWSTLMTKGSEDTATKGATRDEVDRAVAREGEESSEEEAEAHVVAAAASSRPTTSGKSIKHLAQHLAPGAGSAGLSGEVAGKSPVTGPRDHASLSSLPSHKLAAEILQLECRLAAQAEENARLKKRQESGVGGVAVVGFEELASALANAIRMLEKEGEGDRARKSGPGTAATEIAETGDAEYGKWAAGAKAENQRGAKRQRGPQAAAAVRNPSVQDMLKQKWGAASQGVAPPGQPGSSSHSIPPGEAAPKPPGPARATATVTSTVGWGKGKAEDGEAPAAAGSLASRREVHSATAAAAEGRQTTLAPARAAITVGNLHSALASASPIAASVEVKAEKRERGGKKLPPPPVYTIDEDDADKEL